MKRIELFTSLAGPGGSLAPGIHEVPDKLARQLKAGGFAKILPADPEPEAAEKPEPKELETADDKQEKREEATTRGGKNGGKKQRGRRRAGG